MADARPAGWVATAATLADGAALAALHALSFDRGWSEADFAAFLADGATVLIARSGGAPVAMVAVRAAAGEAEILTLATHPDFRGRGLAGELLAQAMAQLSADGVERLMLEVAADNAPARALYLRAGFRDVGRRRGYYPRSFGPMDAIVMARQLDSPPGV